MSCHIRYRIRYRIQYRIRYRVQYILTCIVWWFLRPAIMDCNSGYRSPSSHGRESFFADSASIRSCELKASSVSSWSLHTGQNAIGSGTECDPPERDGGELSGKLPYCWSMWQCSGPWVLKFSDQPKRISSRTLCRILWTFSNFQPLATPFFREKWSWRTPTLRLISVAEAPTDQQSYRTSLTAYAIPTCKHAPPRCFPLDHQ